MASSETSPFHPGELEVQRRAGVAEEAWRVGAIIRREIPPIARDFIRGQRLAVASVVDGEGWPWPLLLEGEPGFAFASDDRRLRVAIEGSPGSFLGERLSQRGTPAVGTLFIDPASRRRMRLNGRLLEVSQRELEIESLEVYSNCPRNIRRREPAGEPPAPPGARRLSSTLDAGQAAKVGVADTFFIASYHPEALGGQGAADASHRGGGPGFVTVEGPDRLRFSDLPGNRLFNTLGNLAGYPRAGLLFVDFETGDLLHILGSTRLLWGGEAAPGQGATVELAIERVVEVERGLSRPWKAVEGRVA